MQETTEQTPRKRGRPPKAQHGTDIRPKPLHYRDPTITDLDAMFRWMCWLDMIIQNNGYGGRSRIAILTGYSRRSVDGWFTNKTMPLKAVVTLSLIGDLRTLGFRPWEMAPHMLTWPTEFDAIPYLPNGTPQLLDPTFRAWLQANAPQHYAAKYTGNTVHSIAYKPPAHIDKMTAYLAQREIERLTIAGKLDEFNVADYYAAKFYDHIVTEEEARQSVLDPRKPGRPKRGTTASGTGHAPPQQGYQPDDDYESMQERLELAAEAKRRETWAAMPEDYVAPVLPPVIPVRSPTMVNSLEEMAAAWGVKLGKDE